MATETSLRARLLLAIAPLCLAAACQEEPPPPPPPDAAVADLAMEEPPDLRALPDLRAPADAREGGGPGATRLRVMASNLTSGDAQSYDPGEGIRILQGLKPDVVMMQEFNYKTNSDADLRAFAEQTLGAAATYYRQPTGRIPNGVVSRYPIRDAGYWDDPQVSDRELVWARIDVPGDRDLWAVSVHLLTANEGVRNTEAQALVSYIKGQVPARDYLAIAGDFNTDSRGEPCLDTLRQVIVVPTQAPEDQAKNGNTNASRRKPYDWVLADPDLDPRQVPVTIGGATFPAGLVFDSRVYMPLGDVKPVLLGDSGAANMQHMAVVRDFLVGD